MADPQIIPFPQQPLRAPSVAPLLAFEGVSIRRGGGLVLSDVSFGLSPHGISCLLGPNGAGKSLCLRLAAQLILPEEGSITCDLSPSQIAYVPQNPILLRRSVSGNLVHALKLSGVRWRDRRERLEMLLSQARLTFAADQPAQSLSSGEAQRLTMVRALASQPQLLLLDEPCASLDPASTAALEELVCTIARSGTKIVLVTHDVGQAKRLADDVVFLASGKVRETGPADRFFEAPVSSAARAYLEGRLLT